ncbi:MAG: TolC family protein [Clostridia bacterium]|jgi:outer membrane protein TolC|nr:TolC family protein [Clostridia bacterium]MCI1998975.1 TolC family protein [Clostridia bacterium]MCI2013725.1 TolC family protein [Clostridia bacterium]
MKYKRLLAVSISALLMFSSTAFAAEKTSDDDEQPMVITYDVAVQRAIDNTTDIDTLNDTIKYLDDCNSALWNNLNGIMALPDESYVLESDIGSSLSQTYNLSSNIKKSEYQKQMLEETALLTTRNYLNTIAVSKESIELMKQNIDVEKENYEQMKIKNKLGMLSDKDLATEKNKVDSLQNNLASTQLALDNAYTSFEKLIGIKNGEKYVIDYDIEYEPFKLDVPLDSYITIKTQTDPSIKAADADINNAKYQKNISTYETSAYSYEEKDNTLKAADRTKGDLVKDMKTNIQTCANNIDKTDEEIKAALLTIDDAKQKYDTAKVNYDVGNITKLQLDQASLAITSAQVSLLQLYSQYDIYKIKMAHPFLITG